MHTDKKLPAGSANYPAGHADAAIVAPMAPDVVMTDKEFAMQQAAVARRGHSLHRRSSATGATGLYTVRWGLVRDLPTADFARRFLAQIGGAL